MEYIDAGFDILESFISSDQINEIIEELNSYELKNKSGGIRNAEKKFGSIRNYCNYSSVTEIAQHYVNGKPTLVRAIIFDKTERSNWLVTWHQDITVAVSKRFDSPNWGPWSVKDGVFHVQPPVEVLEQMVTFRIHLDDANLENGCLKVIPGSHLNGILNREEMETLVQSEKFYLCEAKAGTALVMQPHILHSSSKALNPRHRRILHLEFSSYELPLGISWA